MSATESSYKSLLQGVSQQPPAERLPGQVTAQLNMLSDPVTLPRRRPGLEFRRHIAWAGATGDNLKAWFSDIAGERVHILLNCSNGEITLLDSEHNLIATLEGDAYLVATDPANIRATTVGDEFYILNRERVPVVRTSTSVMDPNTAGYVFVVSGSFSREYTVTVTTSVGSITASYTTPSGSGANDSANATPTYIATQLYNSLNTNKATAGITNVYQSGAYIFVRTTTATNVVVSTSTGGAYLLASKDNYTTQVANLPATLPAQADGFTMRVGDVLKPQYYRYNATRQAWLESGEYNAPSGISNMPVALTKVDDDWALVISEYEGRYAGDEASNPKHRFMTKGITGIGSYQGRLVLLSGALASMSGSDNPRRFFRSSVASVLDDDPIEIGSSANSSAAYEYAVPFQSDLLLFSAEYQALVPAMNAAITPRTAYVVPTSSHAVDVSSPPLPLGRTLMYPTPRSENFFGVMEMVPSTYTDAQYISGDATLHLPKYMSGRCRFSAAASTGNYALFAPSGDKRSLIVHEYVWQGDEKIQQAWHQWTFPYNVAAAYFAAGIVNVILYNNGQYVVGTIDPRAGALTFDSSRRPFSDLWVVQDFTNNTITPPSWMLSFDSEMLQKLMLTVAEGPLAGDQIGFSLQGGNIKTVRSFKSGKAALGIPYACLLAPSPPVLKDWNEVVVHTTKATVLRFLVGTMNSSEFKITVADRNTADPEAYAQGTLFWSSAELETNRGRFADTSVVVVPARTNISSTYLALSTDKGGELNITSLEYVLKYNQRLRRGR